MIQGSAHTYIPRYIISRIAKKNNPNPGFLEPLAYQPIPPFQTKFNRSRRITETGATCCLRGK
jgi:hypothetical protein